MLLLVRVVHSHCGSLQQVTPTCLSTSALKKYDLIACPLLSMLVCICARHCSTIQPLVHFVVVASVASYYIQWSSKGQYHVQHKHEDIAAGLKLLETQKAAEHAHGHAAHH